jgi:hypothetical protein
MVRTHTLGWQSHILSWRDRVSAFAFAAMNVLWPIHLAGAELFGGSLGNPAGGHSTVAVSGRRKARGRLGACGAL